MAVRRIFPVSKLLLPKLLLALLPAAWASFALAQATPGATAAGPAPSRFEVYGGYGYFHPFSSDINLQPYETVTAGGVGSVSGYFNRYLGLQLEGSAFPSGSDDNNCVYTAQAGPVLRVPKGRFVPFFHALGGAAKVGGPRAQTCSVWGWGVTGGFGLDYVLPGFGNHISVRPAQADFQYSRIDNGPLVQPAGEAGGLGEIYNFRLSAGLSLRLGRMGQYGGRAGDTTMTCSVDPAEVYPGDPLEVSSMVADLQPSKLTHYLWTTSGGKINGSEAIEPIDTRGLAPGTYTVSGRIVQGSREHEVASCTASFTLHDFAPPTLSCAADRAAINSGDSVIIRSAGVSPQNRPLTYSYRTTNGQISGSGQTATLITTGVSPGTITVSCSAIDDRGREANATASVVIANPAPVVPVVAQTSRLCSLSFERDRRRPDRVDNEAKGCLDDIALNLNRDPATHLVLTGEHGRGESDHDSAARALNAAEYLVREKGIDRSRLDLRIAAEPGREVRTLLVPAGAVADQTAGQPFDSASVTHTGPAYGRPGVREGAPRRTRRKARRTAPTRTATASDFQN